MTPGETNQDTGRPDNDGTASLSQSGSADAKLTPIRSIKDIKPHNRTELTETLQRAQKGETFLPESLNFPSTMFSSESAGSTSPRRKIVFPAASSPKRNVAEADGVSVSSSFFNSQPGLRLAKTPQGTLNAVKGAYNVFDRKVSSSSSSPRKRKRVATPSIDSKAEIVLTSQNTLLNTGRLKEAEAAQAAAVTPPTPSIIQRLLSDPRCAANFAFLMQVLFNTLVFGCIMAMILLFFFAAKRDVDSKVQSYINEAVYKINTCRREYYRNNCNPDTRVPALESSCTQWENCMSEDPGSVITSVAYFEVMADCVNAFFHNLSFRSLMSLITVSLSAIIVPNVLFSKFRTSENSIYYAEQPNYTETSAPSSPIRVIKRSTPHSSPQKMLDTSMNNSTIFFTPLEGSTPQGRPIGSGAKGSSVRFNPNVSYSFYEYEYQDPNTDSPTLRARRRDKY